MKLVLPEHASKVYVFHPAACQCKSTFDEKTGYCLIIMSHTCNSLNVKKLF